MLGSHMNRAGAQDGFTLIELMVVLLVLAVLIMIAFPTFLGAHVRSQNRAAQAELRDALAAAKTLYSDGSSYSGATAAGLSLVEPTMPFITGASTVASPDISVMTVPASDVWAAAKMSGSGVCYGILDTSTGGTAYGDNLGTCTGDFASANSALTSWT